MDAKITLENLHDAFVSSYRVRLAGRVIGYVTKDQAVPQWYARLPRAASARICRSRRAAIAHLVGLAK